MLSEYSILFVGSVHTGDKLGPWCASVLMSYYQTELGYQQPRNCSWWHHQIETFSALLALCAENSPATGEFPSQRPVTRSFDAPFMCALNKRLSKQSWGWWFETQTRSLWRYRNVNAFLPSLDCYLRVCIIFVDQMMPFRMADDISRNLITLRVATKYLWTLCGPIETGVYFNPSWTINAYVL